MVAVELFHARKRRMARRHDRAPRSAFTLVELLMVIAIVSILAALLLAVAMGAFRTGRDAQVKGEISQLESAIAAFKAVYGEEPPSRIVMYEAAAGWTTADGNASREAWRVKSRAILMRFWPSMSFADTDYNGDGDVTDITDLDGSECLLFFLGGRVTGTPPAPTGFSKNPAYPFATGGSREPPFFEFDLSRIVDSDGDASSMVAGAFGGFEYADPYPSQRSPYLYFSSYGGQGYNPTGAEIPPLRGGSNTTSTVAPSFAAPYQISAGGSPYKPNSVQIISPGADGNYGSGGVFNPQASGAGLTNAGDRDNITNFHKGQLGR